MGRAAHPLVELTAARVREFLREPEAIFWTFVFPVLVAVALGIAFRGGSPETPRIALVGEREAVGPVAALLEGRADLVVDRMDRDQATAALRAGRIDLALTVRGGEGRALELVYLLDPSRPASRAARLATDDAIQRGLGRRDPARTRDEPVRAGSGRYIEFLIPGLVGLNVMSSSMWGIGYTVVLARRRKLLRRLAVTPMRRSHYLLSHMLSRLLFLVAEVAALLGFGWLVFGVAVRGSLVGLALVAVVGGLSFMGCALLVASRTDNTEVASGWMNAFMLPMWLLSGAFFSYERFPAVAHGPIRLLPLTAFNDALRAIVSDGAGALAVWPQLLVLVLWGAIGFAVALRVFRWR